MARTDKRGMELRSLAKRSGITCKDASRDELERKYSGSQGAVLLVEGTGAASSRGGERELHAFLKGLNKDSSIIVFLDGITDTGNLGALLRTFDLFQIDCVILPNRRSAGETETLGKTSSGASAWVNMFTVPNLVRSIKSCKDLGYWVYGAHMEGEPLYDQNLKGKTALVLGGEESGLSRLTASHCDSLLAIPAAGHVDSFNVSVAGGIVLYEMIRQRKKE